jgi:hypothetical protein
MALFQTADGRWIVGGDRSGSEYKGFLGWRDCVIQLTASGATEESVDYLNAFRDYALAHKALGEPIMPPSVNVWISNNGTTTAVQADDLSVDGDAFTIGGIKWTGSAWDYSNAGQGSGGSGGGSGGGAFIVNATFVGENDVEVDKSFSEIAGALNSGKSVSLRLVTDDGDYVEYLYPSVAQYYDNAESVKFSSLADVSSDEIRSAQINVLADGTAVYNYNRYTGNSDS